MKSIKDDIITIYNTDRGILALLMLNFVLSVALLIFSLVNLNTNSTVVKIGYGDIGGYRDGTWVDMIAYSLLAVTLGVFHGLLALRIFHKRGGGMAKFFLIVTSVLILGVFLVLIRLYGEG